MTDSIAMTTLETRWMEYLKHEIEEKGMQLNIDRAALDALICMRSDFETIQHQVEKEEKKV